MIKEKNSKYIYFWLALLLLNIILDLIFAFRISHLYATGVVEFSFIAIASLVLGIIAYYKKSIKLAMVSSLILSLLNFYTIPHAQALISNLSKVNLNPIIPATRS